MAWRKFGHKLEDSLADEDYLTLALQRAFAPMTDKELLCFVMYHICGIEQKHIGRALDGITQQGVSCHLKSAMAKANEEFAVMRAEIA